MASLETQFEPALAYIDDNLDKPVDIRLLSRLANIPKCHFNILFYALFHTQVEDYIALLRLLDVAQKLAFEPSLTNAQIASEAGYQDEKCFEQAFVKAIGQSVSDFRAKPDWASFFARQQPLETLKNGHQAYDYSAEINVVEIEALAVVAIRHQGPSEFVAQTVNAMVAWRKQHQVLLPLSRTFNFCYQMPLVHSDAYQVDIAASVTAEQSECLRREPQFSSMADYDLASLVEHNIDITAPFFKSSIPATRALAIDHVWDDSQPQLLHAKIACLYKEVSKHGQLANLPLLIERQRIEKQLAPAEPSQSVAQQLVRIMLPIV
ncbi:AraC family transcriptional regulator [Shewanella sp. WXL01]|uniref:helix-turn-helix domain-containing protein n=1 Tax=Shewanella sp. WXL01 TaxID=2709721 RepID=UPI0014385440|nr:AraC family transcriptional regulator [Shewanella sp. WXL01]